MEVRAVTEVTEEMTVMVAKAAKVEEKLLRLLSRRRRVESLSLRERTLTTL